MMLPYSDVELDTGCGLFTVLLTESHLMHLQIKHLWAYPCFE